MKIEGRKYRTFSREQINNKNIMEKHNFTVFCKRAITKHNVNCVEIELLEPEIWYQDVKWVVQNFETEILIDELKRRYDDVTVIINNQK